jgi:ABC-2 type transport system ATP-binding protein
MTAYQDRFEPSSSKGGATPHQLVIEAALRFGGGKGHHGLRIVVLVLVVAAIVVAVVLVQQRRSARRVWHEAPPPPPPAAVGHPESPLEGTDDQSSAVPEASEDSSQDERVVAVAPVVRSRPAGTGPHTIEARGLTKHYGDKVAVDDLSFDVKAGHVTGFLGPNGAGKSTTMRMIMGLDAPNAGSVTVNGRHFHDLAWPLREVGALLEAKAIHPGRSAYSHLRMLAQTNRIPRRRVDEVLELVGLASVSRQLVGNFSLGMGQRLGIAEALLGDPGILLFDEPVNGLDTDGIRWVRGLLRRLASEGRTVFVSSHLMSEMALTADQVVVIGKGRLIAEMPIDEFTSRNSQRYVRVRSSAIDRLRPALEAAGASVTMEADSSLSVRGLDAEKIGALSLRESVVLSELAPQSATLEEAFVESTEGDLEYRGDRPQAVDDPKGASA